ncbi:imidazole glycerol phosphate synthase subunit HisH [Endomicrobiia bacterium]|nr:imidazole glycerol phosphate synthase subunit HisH [Endomicrobiia bacterium]
MITVIDYNVGNVSSVLNMCRRLGVTAELMRQSDKIKRASGIILPGVGSFHVAMQNLTEFGLIDILNDCRAKGTKILGICLGMQILFEKGFEGVETAGLGYLKGNVDLIKTTAKLPHMGWNNISVGDVYFVHSYMADFTDDCIEFAEYGDVKIPAIVQKDNVMGCQFHPEKSGKVGEEILRKWMANL